MKQEYSKRSTNQDDRPRNYIRKRKPQKMYLNTGYFRPSKPHV